ncbi:UDP-glucose 6-dehydrogenase [Candidatus Beckwithbacteria bacterium CG10_big_fil_rev_8_21_14_0_10_34_10]|uniref:UDP-glucose 6-dehydrogenase n=1 Tax=Candidatus Beckwithbacteria bacterium CG10_big_fil_rev_8_21_14_0_10_34_10 TaxID=1974495 RepID=A0A2H0W9S3_9BACT|nr:MAG: UDP-glucose 6-dehydrogenase [Candidatus Beckwithbacteria bacterium CG10_big_fil_rev_8_21_14_0_10_34_10]
MNIAVIGTGYVGLVTGAVLASFGNKVIALDVDKEKISLLKKGEVPFFEPGLKDLVLKGIEKNNLIFTSSYSEAIFKASIIFICVGTPAKKNGDYDLSYVYSAAKSIGQNLKDYSVVCIKSTVPPSTSKKVEEIIKKVTVVPFDLASCPEFLKEGSAVKDSFSPSRVVIGTETKKARDLLLKLHQPIKGPRVSCDLKSAQLIKYAANAFLATKISFINSIARLCDQIGADIDKVAEGLGLDPRIGQDFLKAGLGYGGSCFPKDTWALITYAKRLGYDFKFLKEVDNVNQNQVAYFLEKAVRLLGGSIKGKTVSILGLSFKPNTDDVREARSLDLIRELKKMGAKIKVYDPEALNTAKAVLKGVEFCSSSDKALKGSSALLLVTEWEEFKKLNLKKIGKLMKDKVIIDGRNMFDKRQVKSLGFSYEGVGRK